MAYHTPPKRYAVNANHPLSRPLSSRLLSNRSLSSRPLKDTPVALLPYLTHDGSLTAKLEKLGGQRLGVEVRFLGFCLVDNDGKRQLAWVRAVDLGVGGQVWVQAKTVILARHLKGQARLLQFLKDKPIGYVLFKRQKHLPFVRTFFKTDGQFARQTVYDWQGCKVLIEEVFVGEAFR